MIGVISKRSQEPIVEEFFQLFKVPWEFYRPEREYDVVIITKNSIRPPVARLRIIFGSEATPFDVEYGAECDPQTSSFFVEHGGVCFPIYRGLSTFRPAHKGFIRLKEKEEFVGVEYDHSGQRTLRIGYDLFDEIASLLSCGQPVECAQIPTVEIHIAMLRSCILGERLPLIEIPPSPYGFSFIASLTHDVDFISIRDHIFDRTMVGFVLRCLFPAGLLDFRSKVAWPKLLKNWRALISLPGVYLGICRDFWLDLDRYSEIEKGIHSTFFFVPFKNDPGQTARKKEPRYRGVRYNINDYRPLISALIGEGHEVGLHGIDAWQDPGKAQEELEVIRQLTGEDEPGVRMHWLYFSEKSPGALEEAGFFYDSTIGYNDAVGFRSGTTQVFGLPHSTKMLELPLNVMDTALFSRRRMHMSESKALETCRRLFGNMKVYGGVLTINWHARSLSPERNWDAFYIELLRVLRAENAWFAGARQAVKWFNKRRSIRFGAVDGNRNRVQLRANSEFKEDEENIAPLCLRVFRPISPSTATIGNNKGNIWSFTDIPWRGEPEVETPC